MKKILLSLAVAALIICALTTVAFAATPKVTLSSAETDPNGIVELTLTLTDFPDITAFAFVAMTYDETALEYVEGTLGTLPNGAWGNIDQTTTSTKTAGDTIVAFLNGDSALNGVIAKYKFKANTKLGTFPITFTIDARNASGTITPDQVSGSVKVNPWKWSTDIKLNNKTVTYDATEQKVELTGTLPSDATVIYESTTTPANDNKATNAGTYAVKATVSAAGYEDKILNATLKIDPKTVTVTGLTASSKDYDATTAATLSGGTLNGVIAADAGDVSAVMPGEGTFANAKAANNVAVTIPTITLTGAKAANYKLTQPTGIKANINKVNITIKADNKTIMIGDPIPELTWSVTDGAFVGVETATGALATTAVNTTEKDYPITKGTLAVTSNYNLTFVPGTLSVLDKTPQNIVVSEIPTTKTYGDAGFTITATPCPTAQLTPITFESSNTNVATVDASGNVVIKNAGTTKLTVAQAGNATYAPFKKEVTLTVNKVEITVTAANKTNKIGKPDVALTYSYTGALVGSDSFSGELTRQPGNTIGKYDILQGTLTLGDNYNITYNKGTYEIIEKEVQTIDITTAKTDYIYGDADFTIAVTPDATSLLNVFTFESSNPAVAAVEENTGKVTIVGVGNATITAKQAGNADYAEETDTLDITVAKKDITVTSIDLDAKTAVLSGVLAADTAVVIDFNKVNIEVTTPIDADTSNANATNLVLTGDKSENYNVTTTSLASTVTNSNLVTVTITADKGTVTGAGTYLINSSITVTAKANSGYSFSGWYVGSSKVDSRANYTFTITTDTDLTAKFSQMSSVSVSSTVTFVSNGGSAVASITVSGMSAIKAPTDPTKEGYKFDGWYIDSALTKKYNFANVITDSFKLYAKWTKIEASEENPEEPVVPDTPVNPFIDVNEDAWYYEAVMFVYEKEIAKGVSDNEFAPDAAVTRGQFITMLCRAYGIEEMTGDNFADCGNTWYTGYLAAAKQLGIANGVGNNNFAPEKVITREEMVTLIYNYFKAIGENVDAPDATFADADKVSDWAKSAVNYAAKMEYVNGYNNLFNPTGTATRAQLAQIFYNMLNK